MDRTHTQTMNKYNVYVTSIQPATNKLLLCLYCMYQMSYCSTAFYKPHCVNTSGLATNKYFLIINLSPFIYLEQNLACMFWIGQRHQEL